MFGAKRPFDTTKAIEDLKIFPAEVRNLHNKNVIMHCFFKRCIDDEEQFKQCLYCATRLFAPVTPRRSGEALVVSAGQTCGGATARKMTCWCFWPRWRLPTAGSTPNIVQIQYRLCRSILAANEGQKRWWSPSSRSTRTFPTTTTSVCVQAHGAGHSVLRAGPRVLGALEPGGDGRGPRAVWGCASESASIRCCCLILATLSILSECDSEPVL